MGSRMIFTQTPLVSIYHPDLIEDERGFWLLTFCRREFEANGLNPNSFNAIFPSINKKARYTGMHYQVAPHAEVKRSAAQPARYMT